MARRRIDPARGREAVARWAAEGADTPRAVLATAVRSTLQDLAEAAPGRSVEVRVPPFAAVQCVEGPRHSRGTPSNVVETDASTWLALATGRQSWREAVDAGRVHASGGRSDLSALLPLPAYDPSGAAPDGS